MRLPLLLCATLAASLAAQNEILHYKFEGGGNKALNYVPGSPAPGEGTILNTLTTAPTGSFVPGRFGDALNSGLSTQLNVVDTGWAPAVTGDYSYAMWLRNTRGTAAPSLEYICGTPAVGFRVYGSTQLLTVGGAGGATYYRTVANVYAMAATAWVHVAFVVDTTAMTATYYINGVPETPLVLTGPVNITGTSFLIGRAYSTSYPCIYDVDEFRFLDRQATPAEIAAWSSANGAGASEFGSGCDAALSSNGLPVLGNLLYDLGVSTQVPGSVGIMAMGFSRTAIGPLSLPLDLGAYLAPMAGCSWEVSTDVTQLMLLDAQGQGVLPFPVPPVPGFDGVALYAQGLFIGGPRGTMSTNPVGIVLGN